MEVVRDRKGRQIGYIWKDTYFIKKTKEHYMKMFEGFGISKYLIPQLKERGTKKIRFIFEGKVYETDLINFMLSEDIWTDKSQGFNDEQSFIALREMKEI